MVFIGIIGLAFSGRHAALRILLKDYGFRFISLRYKGYVELKLRAKIDSSPTEDSEHYFNKKENSHHELQDIDYFALPEQMFYSPEELMTFVLEHYQDNWVTVIGGPATEYMDFPIISAIEQEHKIYSLRPFYLSVGVDTTNYVRTCRSMWMHGNSFESTKTHEKSSLSSRYYQLASVIVSFGLPKLHEMVHARKVECFVTEESREPIEITRESDDFCNRLTIKDTDALMKELAESIKKEVIQRLPYLLRPPWDVYFIQLCILASHRSNCMKRRVGAVLVSSKSRRIISTGYNGTPLGMKNCNEGGCSRCNDPKTKQGADLSICICLHAEENVLLEAGRERIQRQTQRSDSHQKTHPENDDTEYAILYCTTCPCIGCAKKIIQCGIREVVYLEDYHFDAQVGELFKLANIKCRRIDPSLLPRRLLA